MSDSPTWFRHWPVFLIIAIPAMGVTASLIAVTHALSEPPQMVHGQYHSLGKALVDDWAPERLALAHKLEAQLDVDGGKVSLELRFGNADRLPETLWLDVVHPAHSSGDQRVALHREFAAQYQSEQMLVFPPRARLLLSDDQQRWRLHGRLESGQQGTRLTPGISDG